MFNKKIKLIGLLFTLSVTTAFAQINVTIGEGEDAVKFTPSTRFYLDGATYIQDKTDLSNGVTMPDLRLGFKVDYKQWVTKVDVGFAKGKVSAKDIFLQYNLKKTSYLRIGHYAEPFGLDHMESSGNIKFMTPNATSLAFSPGRKLGVEYIGCNKNFWVAGGVFADGDAVKNSIEGDDGYSTTGRIVFHPIKKEGAIFHVGLAGSFRKADANGYDADGHQNPKFMTYGTSLLTNVENRKPLGATIGDANYQAKYAVELIGAYGSVALQSEFFYTGVKRHSDLRTYQAKGAYAQVAFLAIGGDYAYSSSWARLACPKAKSLEFVARFNYTDLNHEKSEIYGGSMRDWSFAANYYLNKYMVVRLNYSYMNMGSHNPFLADEGVHAIQGRLQVVF